MQSATLAIWDRACLVKDPQISSQEQVPKQLAKYAHFTPKVGGCIYGLSKKNLWRIFNHYGRIPVVGGQQRLEAFKERVAMFQQMVAAAESIKNGEYSEHFDDGYAYKMPPLASYQDVGSRLLTFVDRMPIFADCGCGKSYMALTAAERRMSLLNVMPGKVLVCGKLMTLESSWVEDCYKFTNLKPVLLWCGPKKNRREKLVELLHSDGDVFVTNHDTVRVLEDELTLHRFQGVIVDESTILKSFRSPKSKGGAFGKALMGVSRFAHWRAILTGTPAPNGADDLYGPMHFLDPDGNMLEASYSDFKATFMECIRFGSATKAAQEDAEETEGGKKKFDPVKWYVPKQRAEEIGKIIAPLTFRVKIRDHLDLPERTTLKRVVPMTAEQNRHYQEMKEQLVTVVNDERISVSTKLTQIMKLRQITSGILIDEQEKVHYLPDNPKLEMLDQLLNEEIDSEEKVVIYGQYQAEIEQIVSRYKSRSILSVYGGNSATTNLANIKAFINDPDIKTLVLHPKAGAHGITFTCSHYMIMASSSYSNEENYQAIRRIERAGQKHAMFVWYLLCKGSIDELIWNVLVMKQKNQEELIDQKQTDVCLLKEFLGDKN